MHTTRLIYLISFLIICLLLGGGFYLEVTTGFTPCPLCILQRTLFGLLGVLFFFGLLFANKKSIRFFINGFILLSAGLGSLLAGRQIWLQHFASTGTHECGVSLQYMLHVLPLNEVMQKIFSGSAECRERGLTFLSFDLAEWALLWFIVFLIVGGWLFFRTSINRKPPRSP